MKTGCQRCGASASAERGTPFERMSHHPDYGTVCQHCADELRKEAIECVYCGESGGYHTPACEMWGERPGMRDVRHK